MQIVQTKTMQACGAVNRTLQKDKLQKMKMLQQQHLKNEKKKNPNILYDP